MQRKLLTGQVYAAESQRTNKESYNAVTLPPEVNSMLKKSHTYHRLSDENNGALQKFRQRLILKSYSQNTIRTYTNEFLQFLQIIKAKPAKDFTPDRLKDYLQYCHDRLKLSENTLHSRMNALKFYYEQVLYREKFFWEIPRPKKQFLLPKVISKKQIATLINAIEIRNIKPSSCSLMHVDYV